MQWMRREDLMKVIEWNINHRYGHSKKKLPNWIKDVIDAEKTRPTGTAGLRITVDNNPRQGRFLCEYGQSLIPVFLPRADPFHLQYAPLYRAESSGRRR